MTPLRQIEACSVCSWPYTHIVKLETLAEELPTVLADWGYTKAFPKHLLEKKHESRKTGVSAEDLIAQLPASHRAFLIEYYRADIDLLNYEDTPLRI